MEGDFHTHAHTHTVPNPARAEAALGAACNRWREMG